jgi:signal transduction histidine kinase
MGEVRRGDLFRTRGLHARIVLVVVVAMCGATAVLAWTARTGLSQVSHELLDERRLLTRSLADHLDYLVRSDLEVLQTIGAARRYREGPGREPPDEQEAVRVAYLNAHLFESILLLSGPSTIVAEHPPRPDRANRTMVDLLAVRNAFEAGMPDVTPLVDVPGRGKRVYMLVPLRDWQGRVTRVAAGVFDPGSERLALLLRPFGVGERGSAEIVDRTGTVLTSTDPARRFITSDHGRFIETLIRERKPAVGTCHGCHEGERPARVREVLAFTPLSVAPWGVAIRQPEDEALGSLARLWTRLVLMGSAVLAIGLLFAWGAASSIRRPVRILTDAAERIAGGQMTEPIPPLGEDEVGRLGRALERMRETIRDSHETLERRVEQRTRELAGLYEELAARDRTRAELLRKVISAQEEERRRVARELHDETSQSLAALRMSLETALAAGDVESRRKRLEEAKTIAGRALDELHRLLFDLRPSVLDDLGLASAIRWLAERHLEPLGIAVRCEFSGLEHRLPAEVEIALFRVVQEAITNIAKHARAETVLIQCAARADAVSIEIEDDGRGFDPAAVPPSPTGTGLGLVGMRERVTLLGGTVEIDSSPGEGTRLVLEAPLVWNHGHA